MQHEHYTHTAPDIPSSTALSIFFFLLHFLLMQLLFFLLVPFQDFLHSLLCSRPILHTGQFDQQITHDHSIMGTANDKSYDTTHDNLEDDTHQDIHQVSHQDSTPSAVILHLIPSSRCLRKTHNYSLAGSNPAYLYPVLYTELRPFRFSSLLCLNQRPALALSLELYHVGKNAALMQQLCRRSLFCYCSIFEHHNLICTGNSAHSVSNNENRFILDKS